MLHTLIFAMCIVWTAAAVVRLLPNLCNPSKSLQASQTLLQGEDSVSGKICGKIETLSDWNKIWCGSRY